MPIIFTLNSAQTVEMSVPESKAIDIALNRDVFHRSNHNVNTV